MNPKSALINLRDTVRNLRQEGVETIPTGSLEKVLDELATATEEGDIEKPLLTSAPQMALAKFQAEQENNLAYYSATNRWNLASVGFVVQIGLTALKSATLINGGAAVALLAFIGHVWSLDKAIATALAWPLLLFVSGVLATALAAGTAYLAEGVGTTEWKKTAKGFGWITIVLIVCSYLFFATGCYQAYNAFLEGDTASWLVSPVSARFV